MTDRVFATAPPGKAYVFRHNFSGSKWENVTNKKDGTSSVTFRKRGDKFFIRIAPEGGEKKEEYQLSRNAQIRDSGDGFIQVPLPDRKQLIGIKFKQKEEGPIFLGKIKAEMDIDAAVAMEAVVIEGRPLTMAPGSDQLPKPMLPFSSHRPQATALAAAPQLPAPRPPVPQPPTVSHKPAPAPPQEVYGNITQLENRSLYSGHPNRQYQGQPAVNQYPTVQPGHDLGQPVNNAAQPVAQPAFNAAQPAYNAAQPAYNAVQPTYNAAQPAYNAVQPTYNAAQPAYNAVQPGGMYNGGQQVKANRAMVAGDGGPLMGVANTPGMPGDLGRMHHGVPAATPAPLVPRTDIRVAPRAEPDVPSFSDGDDAKSDHPAFLANAINSGQFEAAHKMINMLQKMAQTKPGKKLVFSYVDGPDSAGEDAEITLNLEIEFQNQNKNTLSLYLNFKASMTIAHIQQELELSHHIPKATQNWIISNQLVKGEHLSKSLKEFGIDGSGTTGKVFIYVMHTKKAQVPKEEYEAIRQCQQEERERKKQGKKPHWEMSTHLGAGTLQPAGPDYMHQPPPRQQAWGPNPETNGQEDIYSRINHNVNPSAAAPPPPPRRQFTPDPTYEELRNYQPHPMENYQQQPRGGYPQAPNQQNFGGGYAPPVDHMQLTRNPPQPQQPNMGMGVSQSHQPQAGYQEQFHWPQPPPKQSQPPQQHLPPQPPQQHMPPQLPQQPPPPPPKPTKPKQVGWSCPQCTFINKPRRPGCEICTCDRPEDYQVPDDVPLDEDEARIMQGLQGSDQMYQQYTEAEKVRKERERVENFQALMQAEEEALVTNDEEFDCPICFVPVAPGEGVRLRGCLHQFCKECLNQAIMASPDAEVKCPFIDNDYQCNVPLPEREIKQLVTLEQLQQLYKRALREAESAAGNSYHCKSTNCEGFCFYEDEVNEFHCPICTKVNCLTCKAIHEGINCQEYQDDLRRRAANDEAAKATQEMLDKMVKDGDAMNCPSCQIVVQKKDGCDWIRCSVCKTEICWATKQARWGPKGKGDTSGGCHCRENGKKCDPLCRNCH